MDPLQTTQLLRAEAAPAATAANRPRAAAGDRGEPTPTERGAGPHMPEADPSADGSPSSPTSFDRRRILGIEVPVIVTLAKRRLSLGRVLEISPGSLIEFGKPCDQPLDLSVNDQTIARGHAVKIGEQLGLRLDRIVSPARRPQGLGPGPSRP